MKKHHVFLSLGSNIDRSNNIRRCLTTLADLFGEVLSSPVYESEPVGFQGACFYNLTVKIETSLSLKQLTKVLKEVEDQQGRLRGGERFSSRTLDIDVLTYDSLCGVYEGIELPRPELFYNAFVLLPMAMLAAQQIEAKSNKSYSALWQEHQDQILRKQKLWVVDFAFPDKVKVVGHSS